MHLVPNFLFCIISFTTSDNFDADKLEETHGSTRMLNALLELAS
jgi:hypothetical protein